MKTKMKTKNREIVNMGLHQIIYNLPIVSFPCGLLSDILKITFYPRKKDCASNTWKWFLNDNFVCLYNVNLENKSYNKLALNYTFRSVIVAIICDWVLPTKEALCVTLKSNTEVIINCNWNKMSNSSTNLW